MNIQLSLTVALSTAILYSIHSTANEHISSYLNYHFPSQRFILFFSFHCYNTILRTLRTILCFVTSSLFFAFFRIEFSVYSSIYTLVYDMIDLWCAFDLVCFSIFAVYILFFVCLFLVHPVPVCFSKPFRMKIEKSTYYIE